VPISYAEPRTGSDADAGGGASDGEAMAVPPGSGEGGANVVVDGCDGGRELIGLGLVVDAQAITMSVIAIVAAGEVGARTRILQGDVWRMNVVAMHLVRPGQAAGHECRQADTDC
jgi:hypothetical protein